MTPEQFCYWLQGFAELNGEPTPEQWKAIKEHLGTVFHKVTPQYFTQSPPQPYPSTAPGLPWKGTEIICATGGRVYRSDNLGGAWVEQGSA